MDLRKEKGSQLRKSPERYGAPQQNISRNKSPFNAQPDLRHTYNSTNNRSPDYGDSRITRDTMPLNQSYGQRLTSPQDQDSQARIEQRHEDLKRQIALKEQQLANMTNERDTAKRLRNKLGLTGYATQQASRQSIVSEERNKSPMGMGGYRTTHVGRPITTTSQNRLSNQDFDQNSRQQLQFHPSKLEPRAYMTQTQSSQSPLRAAKLDSRSRSKGRLNTQEDLESRPYDPREASFSYNTAAPNERSISPYTGGIPAQTGGIPGAYRTTGALPPKRTSPLRSSPLRDQPQAFISPPQEAPGARAQLYRDRIDAMNIDNSSLQRRLSQVGSELERITQDKEEQQRQLNFHEHGNDRIRSMIENKDNTDVTNQSMHEDLIRNKEENVRLQSKLQEEEMVQHSTGNQLVDTAAARKNLELESDNLNSNLGKKLRMMDELSKERVVVLSDLQHANYELERMNRQHLSLNHENIDMENHVQRLQSERHELLRNLEQLTITYDDCVHDITRERRNMDGQNDWQTKLIVTKIIFENILMFQKVRRQKVWKEIQEYAYFDKISHDKLKAFSNTLHKLGQFKQKIALNQWYDNSLKPLGTKKQNEDISIVIQANSLQARVFYAWKQFQQVKLDRYLFKTNAIERIWHLMNRGAKKEMKRAMTIWKQRKQFNVYKQKKLRDMILKMNKDNSQKAFLKWKTQSTLMMHCCRVKILQIEYSQKLYLSQAFQQMRYILRKEKQLRYRTLNSVLKAWKDNIHYNRHLMQTNMAAIQFVQTNNRFILKNCFDELRQNREQMKFMTLDIAVKEDVNIAIRDTKKFNIDRETSFLEKNQLRASFIVRAMMGKKLFSFFLKWKKETDHLRVTCKTRIYDRLMKISRNYQLMYFQRWRDQNNLAIMQKKSKIVQEVELKNSQWHKEVLGNENNIQNNENKIRNLKRRLIDKTFRKMLFKRLSLGMKRWKNVCNVRGSQEEQAAFLIKNLRMRFLNDSFTKYLQFYKKSLQHDRNMTRAAHLHTTLKHKRMRTAYNAICFETNRQKTSQKYWKRIFGKMENFMQGRALKTWLINANLRHENKLINHQDRIISEISQRNQEIKRCEETDYTQAAFIASQIKSRRNKAYKLLGNYFKRLSFSKISENFRTWKENVDTTIHKQGVLLKTIQHLKKNQFLMLRSVLAKFMSQGRQREFNEKIRQTEIESEMHNIKRKQNVETQSMLRSHQKSVIEQSNQGSSKRGENYNKVMAIIERRSQECVFGSRKRMIWMCWRHAVKQQKAFLLCIENVLTRSMQFRGLQAIFQKSKDVHYTKKVTRTLNKMFARINVTNCTRAMTKWKLTVLSKVEGRSELVLREMSEKQRVFESFVQKCKETNNARCLLFFAERNKNNLYQGWVNVIKQLQLVKEKKALFLKKSQELKIFATLKRWKMRSDKSVQSRFKVDNLVRSFKLKYKKSSFNALKKNYRNMKHMTSAISNLEKMMRDKIYADSFKNVRSYAISKGMVFINNKKKAAEDLYSLIKQQYNKRIKTEFQRYKRKCMTDEQKREKLKQMLGSQFSLRVRKAFEWWKNRSELLELKAEMSETGPVRAQYFDAMVEIENLKDFMRQEGFTEKEIQVKCKDWFGKNEQLMKKYMARMRNRLDPKKRGLLAVWNRWRQYVGIRKLFKYHMLQTENNCHNVKADLQRAFNQWKRGPYLLEAELSRLSLDKLKTLAIQSTKQVAECSNTLAENQSIQNHLLIQRDEFLNYYVKSQILAMALIKDRSKFAQMQAISRWLWQRKQMNKRDLLAAIRDAAYMQANLEAKRNQLEEDNGHLENENAEIGQFTDDGTVISKNMLRLKSERDKLARTIAESQQDFLDLQAENERLRRMVEDAELRAKTDSKHVFKNTYKILVEQKDSALPGESEADRVKRVRFEKLEKKQNYKGPSIR